MIKLALITVVLIFLPYSVLKAQPIGAGTATFVSTYCEEFLNNTAEPGSRDINNYCRGYLEGILTYKENLNEIDVADCYPSSKEYELFLDKIILNFLAKYKTELIKNDDIDLAIPMINQSIKEEYDC